MKFNKSLVAKLGFTNHYKSTIGNMVSHYGITNNIPSYVKDSEGIHIYGNVNIHIYQVADLQPSIVVSISHNFKRKHCRTFNHEHKQILRTMIDPKINMREYIWNEVKTYYKKIGIH